MTGQNPQELAAFLESLEDYVPTNFTASIVNDSLQLQKQKMKAPKKALKEQGYNLKDERLVLSMAEVAQALQEV
ncbi:TPA: hypothetical protein ACH3X1_008944 [Trebouxia sp. C0004]